MNIKSIKYIEKSQHKVSVIIIQTILALCLALLVIFQSIVTCCFDLNFYAQNFHDLQTSEKVDISEVDSIDAIKLLLDYISDKRNDLEMKVTLNSTQKQVEMYNQREKAHMVDVKALYQLLLHLRSVVLALALIIVCYLFISYIRKFKGLSKDSFGNLECLSSEYAYFWQSFIKASLYSLILIATCVSLIYFFAAHDFANFWWKFHELLFKNDLWQLDPAASRMINLVEGQFFNNLVMYIIKRTALGLTLTYLALLLFPTICLKLLKKTC